MGKRIVTKRLILRKVGERKSDADDIAEACNNLNVTKWLLLLPYPYTKQDAINWINSCEKNYKKKEVESYEFAVELKKDKKLIGGVSLMKVDKDQGTANVGYWVNAKDHRMGYGSEALRAVLDFAFKDLKLRRIRSE